MRILVLNGSPHTNGATSDMVSAFSIGAMEAGHEVISINVAHKNIKGCMACEYCREKEKGICVQKDDMQAIYPEILLADMVVFASPVHYFGFSAQLQAMISRIYCWHKLPASRYALILSSGSPDVFDGIIGQYRHIVKYFKGSDEGILTVSGKDNKSEEILQKMYDFGKSLEDPKEEKVVVEEEVRE